MAIGECCIKFLWLIIYLYNYTSIGAVGSTISYYHSALRGNVRPLRDLRYHKLFFCTLILTFLIDPNYMKYYITDELRFLREVRRAHRVI